MDTNVTSDATVGITPDGVPLHVETSGSPDAPTAVVFLSAGALRYGAAAGLPLERPDAVTDEIAMLVADVAATFALRLPGARDGRRGAGRRRLFQAVRNLA